MPVTHILIGAIHEKGVDRCVHFSPGVCVPNLSIAAGAYQQRPFYRAGSVGDWLSDDRLGLARDERFARRAKSQACPGEQAV